MYYQPSYTVSEATKRMEHYCAYQDRCHQEVGRKLKDMNMIQEASNQIILHLLDNDFLNESRFAQSYVRGKFRIKKWGKIRISQELKRRNISTYNITLGLKEIPEDEYLTSFNDLALKRFNQLDTEVNIQKKRKKFVDYLLYRGWESSLTWGKVRELF